MQSVDSLLETLEANPNAVGYIVINRKQAQSKQFNLQSFVYQDIISLHIKRRKLNSNRLQIIRGESQEFKIDFYVISDKSKKPEFVEVKWDLIIPSKHILFDEGYGGQLCEETLYNLTTFSEILSKYPKARGHFIIYTESIKDFPKAKEEITNKITKAGIPLNRFRFFFRKNNSTLYSYSKLWLVPNNKR